MCETIFKEGGLYIPNYVKLKDKLIKQEARLY